MIRLAAGMVQAPAEPGFDWMIASLVALVCLILSLGLWLAVSRRGGDRGDLSTIEEKYRKLSEDLEHETQQVIDKQIEESTDETR